MRVRLLGTGNAFHEDGRGSPCLLIETPGESATLVDVGPTAPMALARQRVNPARIDRVFFTHLHGDHTAGWPFLLLDLAFRSERTAPVAVWGPRRLRETLTALTRLCYQGLLADPPFEVRYRELDVAEAAGCDAGTFRFDVLPMLHADSSLGYRFHLGGKTMAVSGDTAWCENLENLARGTDLLVVECTSVDRQEHPHLSLAELRERVDRLASGRIVLVHLTDAVAEDLARDPLPRVVAGHDGLVVDL